MGRFLVWSLHLTGVESTFAFSSVCFWLLPSVLLRVGKMRTALSFADRALELESQHTKHLPYYLPSADTYLNQCAILSELKRYGVSSCHVPNFVCGGASVDPVAIITSSVCLSVHHHDVEVVLVRPFIAQS
jgi:hypothetical protein